VAPVIAPRVREACQRARRGGQRDEGEIRNLPSSLRRRSSSSRRSSNSSSRGTKSVALWQQCPPPQRGRRAVMEPIKSPYYEQLSSGLLAPAR
jgi:hypothetical protein